MSDALGQVVTMSMNAFRILGDVSHTASKCILIYAIHSNKSAEGRLLQSLRVHLKLTDHRCFPPDSAPVHRCLPNSISRPLLDEPCIIMVELHPQELLYLDLDLHHHIDDSGLRKNTRKGEGMEMGSICSCCSSGFGSAGLLDIQGLEKVQLF